MSNFNFKLILDAFDKNGVNLSSYFKHRSEFVATNATVPSSVTEAIYYGLSKIIFNTSNTYLDDNTSEFSLSLHQSSTNSKVYKLINSGGTNPVYRENRVFNSAVDSECNFVINSSGYVTLTSSLGTLMDFTNVEIGDIVTISGLSANNINQAKIISKTVDSITYRNLMGTSESDIIIGTNIKIYSPNGVQVGQNIKIGDSFDSSSHGLYKIVDVDHEAVYFSSTNDLIDESNVLSQPIILRTLKQLIYLECSGKFDAVINGERTTVTPPTLNSGMPATIMITGEFYSLSIENNNASPITVKALHLE